MSECLDCLPDKTCINTTRENIIICIMAICFNTIIALNKPKYWNVVTHERSLKNQVRTHLLITHLSVPFNVTRYRKYTGFYFTFYLANVFNFKR